MATEPTFSLSKIVEAALLSFLYGTVQYNRKHEMMFKCVNDADTGGVKEKLVIIQTSEGNNPYDIGLFYKDFLKTLGGISVCLKISSKPNPDAWTATSAGILTRRYVELATMRFRVGEFEYEVECILFNTPNSKIFDYIVEQLTDTDGDTVAKGLKFDSEITYPYSKVKDVVEDTENMLNIFNNQTYGPNFNPNFNPNNPNFQPPFHPYQGSRHGGIFNFGEGGNFNENSNLTPGFRTPEQAAEIAQRSKDFIKCRMNSGEIVGGAAYGTSNAEFASNFNKDFKSTDTTDEKTNEPKKDC